MINDIIDNGDGTSTILYDDGSTLVVDDNGSVVEASLVAGSDLDDKLKGTSGDDYMFGFAGDDVLKGKDGNDVMDGGADEDIVFGGNGDDLMIYDVQENADNDAGTLNFYDGGSDNDTLVLDLTYLSNLPTGFDSVDQYAAALKAFFDDKIAAGDKLIDFREFNADNNFSGALTLEAKNFEAIQIWTPPVANDGAFMVDEDDLPGFLRPI